MPFTKVKNINQTEYELQPKDHQLSLVFLQACTIKVRAALPDNFACAWTQASEGVLTFVAGPGVTFKSRTGRNTSIHQGSSGGIHAFGDSFRLIGV